jgi:hypothetical protein
MTAYIAPVDEILKYVRAHGTFVILKTEETGLVHSYTKCFVLHAGLLLNREIYAVNNGSLRR